MTNNKAIFFTFLLAGCLTACRLSVSKAGVVRGFDLSFSWNGDRYQWHSSSAITESSGNWNLYVLAAPATRAQPTAQGFSFGAVNSVEEFLSKAQ